MRLDEFQWTVDDLITHDKVLEFTRTHSDTLMYLKGDILKFGEALPEWRGEEPYPKGGFPPRQRIWVTGHSDYTIDDDLLDPLNQAFDAVYSVNLDSQNHKAHPFPIGICDYHSPETYQDMWRASRQPQKCMNTAFMSFNIDTCMGHRFIVDTMFREEPWVTHAYPLPMNFYYKYIRNHQFVICPRGNGFDTHRMWEALYLGSIPICVSNPVVDYFAKYLPICAVKSWNHVTPDFLELEYERIMECDTWNMDMMKLGWWKEKILSHV